MFRLLLPAVLAALAVQSGAVRRLGKPVASNSSAPKPPANASTVAAAHAAPAAHVQSVLQPPANASTVAAVHAAPAAHAHSNLSEADQLAKVSAGLEAIANLRSVFSSRVPQEGAAQFANGALSDELSKQDSSVWATINEMVTKTQEVQKEMKGKGKADQQKLMESLEGALNSKAGQLENITNKVSKHQQQLDEEYVLGLLMMHRKDWSMTQQLNATKTFMKDSPILRKLYQHHSASGPLAPQLAKLMDTAAPGKAEAKAVAKPKAEAKAAAKLFLQLVDSLQRTRV